MSFAGHYIQNPSSQAIIAKQWFMDSFKKQWTVPDWRCRLIYVPQVCTVTHDYFFVLTQCVHRHSLQWQELLKTYYLNA
jgi:hypothetical protein